MATYDSTQLVKSGVPLGGIGAGKLEIMPTGTLDNFTFLNNMNQPLTHSPQAETAGVLGFHFGIYCKSHKERVAKLLQTVPIAEYPHIKEIRYRGEFPFAFLDYCDEELPVKVSLEAFSPFIPGEEKNSGLPVAIFCFKLSNPTSRPMDVALLVNVRNIIGEWCVGRFNQVIDDAHAVSLDTFLRKPSSFDQRQGTLSVSVQKSKHYSISFLGEYNLCAKPFIFDQKSVLLEAFELFSKEGDLPSINSEIPVNSESVELGGALSVKAKLSAHAKVSIPVIFSWNFPFCYEGHAYNNYFRNTREVTHYVVNNYRELHQKTAAFVASVKELKMPAWLTDATLNNLYTFFSSTYWTRKMKFAFMEAPQTCPLAGTLDVRFYSSIALALLFPQLELRALLQAAEAQRADGYVMHDLGRLRLDAPSVSTNRLQWKDLNSKFILMAYRDYLWTNDGNYLRRMFPFVKKAYYWLIDSDKNKDFLPDNEGADHTFDLWECFGASSYTSSLFLAASLAYIKLSEIMEDKDAQKVAKEYFQKGKVNFEKKLWQKTYFIEYNNRHSRNYKGLPKMGLSCTVGQLVGQWYAHLLDLGYIVSKDKVQKAIKTVFALNAKDTPYGLTNAVFADGSRNEACSHATNVWIGLTFAFLSLAIYEGFEEEAEAVGARLWATLCDKEKNIWNQPDMISSADGHYLFGDRYMRNLSVWAIVFSLAKRNKKIEHFIGSFKKDLSKAL